MNSLYQAKIKLAFDLFDKARTRGMTEREYKRLQETLVQQGFPQDMLDAHRPKGLPEGVTADVPTRMERAKGFIRRNRLALGLGAVGLAGAGYLATRKPAVDPSMEPPPQAGF